jgi:hypothetical protein
MTAQRKIAINTSPCLWDLSNSSMIKFGAEELELGEISSNRLHMS